MQYASRLDIEKYKAGEFVLLADFRADFTFRGQQYRLAVPRGFITDFASVPKLIQILPGFDVNGDSAFAAVIHDYAYCCAGEIYARHAGSGAINLLELTRKECDSLLFDGLVASGYARATASLFYAGVRLGGRFHWRARGDGLNSGDFVPDSYWQTQETTE